MNFMLTQKIQGYTYIAHCYKSFIKEENNAQKREKDTKSRQS